MDIKKQYNDAVITFRNDSYVEIKPWNYDISHLKVTIKGLEGTPYEGGLFTFKIKMKKKTNNTKKSNAKNFKPLRFSREDINSEKTVGDFKKELCKKWKINPILSGISLIHKGKVLSENIKIRKIDFDPEKDVLTVTAIKAYSPRAWNYGKAYCATVIWHPNIDSLILPSRKNFHLGENWDPNVNLSEFIEGIKKLIQLDPKLIDTKFAYNREAANQFLNRRHQFNLKAKKWTQKYA